MKKLSLIPGIKELDRINQYALEALTEEERQFVEKMNKVVEDYKNEQGDIFGFNEQIKIRILWQKYEYLEPFQFKFDPQKKMPEVYGNLTAFIIWSTWNTRHIRGSADDIKKGSLSASKILLKSKPPFPEDVKKEAVVEFLRYLYRFIDEEKVFVFWQEKIFPYLDGKLKFKWEIVQKCFSCYKNAIAICDSCSPTSATGLTPEKPLCKDCIAKTPNINIVRWLVLRHEGEEDVKCAFRKLKSKKKAKTAKCSLRNNRDRGKINPLFYFCENF